MQTRHNHTAPFRNCEDGTQPPPLGAERFEDTFTDTHRAGRDHREVSPEDRVEFCHSSAERPLICGSGGRAHGCECRATPPDQWSGTVPASAVGVGGSSRQESPGALETEAREHGGDEDEDDGRTGGPLYAEVEG